MSLRSDVLYSLKWLAGARFAGQLIAWTVTLVVIRLLKPSDYGLMALATIMIGFADLLKEMGLYTALVQKRDVTSRQVEQAFGFLVITNSVIYLIIFLLAPVFAGFFQEPRLINVIRVLGIQFPLAAVGVVQDAMLSRRMDFKRKSFVNLAVLVSNSFTTLAFALAGSGVWALVYGSLAGSIIRSTGLILAAQYWCRPRFKLAGMNDLLRFGSFVSATRLIWYGYSRADVFIIGKLLGKEVLGFYYIAMELATLPMRHVSELLNQVGLAAYSSIQQDMTTIRSHYRKAIRMLSFVSFPVFWGISSISPVLIPVVLGQRWEPAATPLQLLGLMMPVRMVGHSGTGVLSAIGKPHIETLNILISFVIMVPAFFVGTYYGGLVGATLTWVLVYPIVRLIQLRITLRPLGLKVRDYLGAMAGPAMGGVLMYLAVIFVQHALAGRAPSQVLSLIAMICAGAVVYTAFMWLLRRDDCMEMLDLVKRQQ